ncbi:hypothetical protein [Paracoccus methylarcula]|uniref:hypothetical protein n=1 Tax=Paracoccus methylarcula TaxID=72022 RepID=UPI0011CEB9D1|nr:hypothetical protein [Paracoccus methylarcula]
MRSSITASQSVDQAGCRGKGSEAANAKRQVNQISHNPAPAVSIAAAIARTRVKAICESSGHRVKNVLKNHLFGATPQIHARQWAS